MSGGAEPGLSRRALEVIRRADDEAKKLKDDYVSVEHYVLAMAQHDREVGGALRAARRRRTTRSSSSALASVRGTQRITDPDPEGKFQALEKYCRDLTESARKAKTDPVVGRDEEIRRVMQVLSRTDEEQPGAHRRAGRRQDGDRRGHRAADRPRRRARVAEEQATLRARHGRARGGREVPRRVRGPAEGGAQGGRGVARADHPVHRRAAHDRRRGRRRGFDGRRRTCSSRPSRAASCAASARRRSTNTGSASRRTRRSSGAFSPSSSRSRRSRTRSPSCAG